MRQGAEEGAKALDGRVVAEVVKRAARAAGGRNSTPIHRDWMLIHKYFVDGDEMRWMIEGFFKNAPLIQTEYQTAHRPLWRPSNAWEAHGH